MEAAAASLCYCNGCQEIRSAARLERHFCPEDFLTLTKATANIKIHWRACLRAVPVV